MTQRTDPLEPLARLFRDLRTSPSGLTRREAARRLEVWRPNELARRGGRRWPAELAQQLAIVALFPFIVWRADETRRLLIRRLLRRRP